MARNGVDGAMKQAASGDMKGARDSLLDAYLNGVEPVEPRLRARDPGLVAAIEQSFLKARLAAEQGSPSVQDEAVDWASRRACELILKHAGGELVEGVMSLLAVGMLLYAALWLNARSNVRKFMGQLRAAMQGAAGRGSAAGLFAIAFTAMFRESLETAIFLQGLAIDSASGALWGTAAGAVALISLVLFISRVGYRLPMKPLFNASTVLLVATAVVLLGKGVHAVQEVGLLPLAPIRMVEVEALGVFPDAYSFVPQLVLALVPLVWVLARHRPDGKAGEEVTPPDGAKHA